MPFLVSAGIRWRAGQTLLPWYPRNSSWILCLLAGRLSVADPDRRDPVDFAVNHVLGPASTQADVFDGECGPSWRVHSGRILMLTILNKLAVLPTPL